MTSRKPLCSITRALHIGKYFPPHHGGMETYLKELLLSMQQQGVSCCALVHKSKIGLKSNWEIYSHDDSKLLVVRAATWLRVLFSPVSPLFAAQLRRLIAEQDPQILHLHLPNPSALFALLLPSARRLPWIIHWQSDVSTDRGSLLLKAFYYLFRPLERALLKKARWIVVSSPNYLRYSEALKAFKKKCRVIPLGISDRFGQVPSEFISHSGPLRVLALGRLTHYKGFDLLIEAVAQTSNVSLRIVGEGAQRKHLVQYAAQLGVQGRVSFLGSLSDDERDKELLESDCLCLPSTDRAESFGLVLLEAMSAGKACIASNVVGSGMSWLIEDGHNGLIFQNNSVNALSLALNTLQQNRGLLDRFGKNGRTKYEQSFTVTQTTKAVLSLYSSI